MTFQDALQAWTLGLVLWFTAFCIAVIVWAAMLIEKWWRER